MVISLRLVSDEEAADLDEHRCTARRSRRSHIRCEMDIREHAKFHAGRGKLGQWYTWRISKLEIDWE